MNCREAEHQIFAERDGALDSHQRAALGAHVAQCATCRQMRDGLAHAIESWRVSTEAVRTPDADLEWLNLRREIRRGAGAKPASTARSPWATWVALPAAAAAALAVVLAVRHGNRGATPEATKAVARAHVEASVENASPVVFVDDKSGWVFVWATNDPKHI